MKKISFNSEFFNIKDTLECGQVFRFKPHLKGYLVFSSDKCAYCYTLGENTVIECSDVDEQYFYDYFDLSRDYQSIYKAAQSQGIKILTDASKAGKGIRILNQNRIETLFSFIVSQNNNIPRIKGIIEKLCEGLGEKKTFNGIEYFTFPTPEVMAKSPIDFYRKIGLGYRAEYIYRLAHSISGGFDVAALGALSTKELKKQLTAIYGVGPKVADCVSLFGYHKSDSFPVDTWIDKVYREDFNGRETSREKISEWFVNKFADNSGYIQQYLFHYKRLNK